MNPSFFKRLGLFFLIAILPVLSQAQDNVVRRTTTTTSTTRTTTRTQRRTTPVVNKPTTGTLTITSTPAGVAVKVNDKYVGETPLTLEKQKPGSYSVTFSSEGYETQSKSVTVIVGNTATCNATLTKKQVTPPEPAMPTTGVLIITSSPSGAAIQIDGKASGVTPITLPEQKPGAYKVMFSAEGYETSIEETNVVVGHTTTCKVMLKKEEANEPQPQSASPRVYSEPEQIIAANGVFFKMIRVDGGTFTMGATSEQGDDAWDDETPIHQVTLSTFCIAETEVTQNLWEVVMGSNPSKFRGANLPVENVSWDDCQTFIQKLNQLTGLTFRLPTEAEWEFAARGGIKSKGYKYSGSNKIKDVAWYDTRKTHPVKRKLPNELGLFDMSGNVWEWCQNWYDKYDSMPQTNPKGSSSGSIRVRRGGSWFLGAEDCRVSYRGGCTPGEHNNLLGLRLVL